MVATSAWGLALMLAVTSCSTSVGRPRFPQVEQVTEAVHGGGERYRAHTNCAAENGSVDGLVRCMHAAGWDFVARGAVYPEAECWEARDHDERDHIPPQCFVRAPEHEARPAN